MQIEVPACDGKTICMKWENGFEIKCTAEGSAVVLSANQAGLVSLAFPHIRIQRACMRLV